jgi:hypothetical protein
MASPFPGMDPYLESPAYWPDFHARFVNYWCDALADQLPDNYEIRMDERNNLVELRSEGHKRIEEENRETYIEILHRPDRTRIAVLELLSPANKEESGRSMYLAKRNALLLQAVHLVELDLLLGGQRLPLDGAYPPGHYYALIARWTRRPDCDVYAWTLRRSLPPIPIPLKDPDPDVWLDLGAVFATAYERGRYARSIDYAVPPRMACAEEDRQWMAARVQGWQR